MPIDRRMDKEEAVHTMEYHSASKKKEITQSAPTDASTDGRAYCRQVRETQVSRDIACMWKLKYGTGEPTYKNSRNTLRDTQNRLVVANGKGRGRVSQSGIGRCNLWRWEWIRDKVLLTSTGNYIEYPAGNHTARNSKNVYMLITEERGVCVCVSVCIYICAHAYIQVYDGILLSQEKEWNCVLYRDMEGF